jgi:hypothetical protein
VIQEKTEFAMQNDNSLKSIKEIVPQIEKAREIAALRIRDFLISKVNSLKKPRTNIQIIQQNVLLKLRFFHEFLESANPSFSNEVRSFYGVSGSKIFAAQAKNYAAEMAKIADFATAERAFCVGNPRNSAENGGSGVFRALFSGTLAGNSATSGNLGDNLAQNDGLFSPFSLGNRREIFARMDEPSIAAGNSANSGPKMPKMGDLAPKTPPEACFRSFLRVFLDAATAEFLFVADFFGRPDLFFDVFGRAMWVENWVFYGFLLGSAVVFGCCWIEN